ncbi:MAG: hypothetical protein ACK500_07295 [Flavobacteriales bacterium]
MMLASTENTKSLRPFPARLLVFFLWVVFLTSCKSATHMRREQYKMLDTRFSVSISNVPFKVSDEDYAEITFLKLFKIQDEGVDSIRLEIADSSEMGQLSADFCRRRWRWNAGLF